MVARKGRNAKARLASRRADVLQVISTMPSQNLAPKENYGSDGEPEYITAAIEKLKNHHRELSLRLPSKSPKVTAETAASPRPASSTDNKRSFTPSQPKSLGPTPAPTVLVKTVSLLEAAGGPAPSQPALHNNSQLVKRASPEKGSLGDPPDPVGVNDKPNPGDVAAAKVPSPPQVVGPGPDENKTPSGSRNPPEDSPSGRPFTQKHKSSVDIETELMAEVTSVELELSSDQDFSSHRSPLTRTYNSDIESLYASPSPRAVTEIEPIELESDPDFEMMEQLLLSHRGSQSSQPIKKELSSQPLVSARNPRPLKRQRSHPPPHESSQAANSQPAKRPKVKAPRLSDLETTLNDRRKHPEFWDLDGTVVLQVDDVIFRVMRSTLSKASPWFRRLFSEDFEHLEVMAGCPVYTIEEDLSHLDFANLLGGLENGLEYALNPPHYLRIVSIFRAASLLEFGTLQKWSLGCIEKQWPADLPPPSKPSKFGGAIPWAEETLVISTLLDVPQLAKRVYWELCARPGFARIDDEVCDDEVEEIMPTRSRLPRSVMADLLRLRERLHPEWMRITGYPPNDILCTRAMASRSTHETQLTPCSLNYAGWRKVISEVEVDDMTVQDRWTDPISALEVMIVEIDWEKEGGFCVDCTRAWKTIWTKDREKIWKNLEDWLDLDVVSES